MMTDATIARLLELNRRFYAVVGTEFDRTRQGLPAGIVRTLESLPPAGVRPLRVIDVGCGNGRLARALEGLGRPVEYTGIDADAGLLRMAGEQTAGLEQVSSTFVWADLAEAGWSQRWEAGSFDVAYCLAVLHHFPGRALRRRILAEIGGLTRSGDVILSVWQYQNSARLVGRMQPWSAVGLGAEEVEAGDALLPWDQGVHALRYVHALGVEEVEQMAHACGLVVRDHYFADGASGDLNLYVVLGAQSIS